MSCGDRPKQTNSSTDDPRFGGLGEQLLEDRGPGEREIPAVVAPATERHEATLGEAIRQDAKAPRSMGVNGARAGTRPDGQC